MAIRVNTAYYSGALIYMLSLTEQFFVREQILNCQSCELRKSCQSPVPFTSPTRPSSAPQIAIVGEAPGSTEDRVGEPFIGAAGQLFRTLLKKHNLSPDNIHWTNTVQCWPANTPTRQHVEACRYNKWESLVVAEPEYIILAGSIALSGFRPDLKISLARGRPLWWGRGEAIDSRINHWADRIIIYPIYHPAAALRSPDIKDRIEQDLERFSELYYAGYQSFINSWPDTCVACSRPVHHYDENGGAWCTGHGVRQMELL